MDTIKIEIDKICRGCLSLDRDLKPLKENVDLFFILLGENVGNEDYFNLLLCWECRAILKRIETHQIRFQKSLQAFIDGLIEPLDNIGLSCLQTFSKDGYDLVTEYNEFENQKIEFNEIVKTEVKEMSFEEESSDSFCGNDNQIKEETDKKERKRKLSNRSRQLKNLHKKIKSSIVVNYDKEELSKYAKYVQLGFKDIENLSKDKMKAKGVTSLSLKYLKKKISMMNSDIRRKNCGQGITCSLCKDVFFDTVSIKNHWKEHTFDAYRCIYCDKIMAQKHDVLCHMNSSHKRILFCKCGHKCYSRREYFLHYKKYHSQFVCNYCQKTYKSREAIEKHMMSNHLPKKCELCHRAYTKLSRYKQHYYIYHADLKREANEMTYCVECDIHFQNNFLYKRHLRTAVAHKPRIRKKTPCPVCGKIFSRKSYMKNHYNLIHEQRSKYYCEVCDKYFANGYSIRTHKKFVHEKLEKPRDKICDICGRGFFTNRVLINHKRTHTGERPHQCSFCDAAFAQDTARKTHERTQHKNVEIVKNETE